MAPMGHARSDAALRYQHAAGERGVTIATRLDRMVDETIGRSARCLGRRRKRAQGGATPGHCEHTTRRARAMHAGSDAGADSGDGADQDESESGRRESNPRSQLGKLMFCR